MLNRREKKICYKYSKKNGIQCDICPLRIGTALYDFRCKANSFYNRKTKEWEYI